MIIQKKSLEVKKETEKVESRKTIFSVDGEIGRFSFNVFDIKSANNQITPMLPLLKGKEIELAYFNGSCETSYRKTTEILNRFRHQEKGGTPYRTLNSGIEQEARKINNEINIKSKQILESHNFTPKALPINDLNSKTTEYHELCENKVNSNLESLKKELSPELTGLINKGNVPFEDSERTTNISIDDVSSKRQKIR